MLPSETVRIAGIDLGSNSLRLRVVDQEPDGALVEVTRRRAALRLATDAFGPGNFSDDTIYRLARVVGSYAADLDLHHVRSYRAVGTEAFRRVSNGAAAVDRIGRDTRMEVEILTASEEATLVAGAVETAIAPDRGGKGEVPLIVDLGGGSLDLILPGREEAIEPGHESHALGLAARFEDYLAEHGGDEDARRQLAEQAFEIGRDLESELLGSCSEGTSAVMVGGQAGMLDRLAVEWAVWEQDAARMGGISLSLFEKVRERVTETPVATLVRMGVPEDRAPMLAGAAALYASMAVRVGARRIVLPRVGLMDGLLETVGEKRQSWPPGEESGH